MKTIASFALCLALFLPVMSKAEDVSTLNLDALKCTGINYNIKKNTDGRPSVVTLNKEDSSFHVVFNGKLEGHEFRVVIEKSSKDVHGYINRPNGEMLTFSGVFQNHRFEFGAHRGMMMPVQTTAIGCYLEE